MTFAYITTKRFYQVAMLAACLNGVTPDTAFAVAVLLAPDVPGPRISV
jgi:hypothetical protein